MRAVLLSAFAAALLPCTQARAAVRLHPCVDAALTCLVSQQYGSAVHLVDSVLATDPANADALYMLVTIEQTRLLDYEAYAVEGQSFLGLADSVLRVLKKSQGEQDRADSLKYLFYEGNVYGGKSLIMAKCGNWFGAMQEAVASVTILGKAKQLDSTFSAACLGIGLFNYYLSQNLSWIPFMGDKSDEGLADIEKATHARFPFNYAAKNSLSWILMDRKEYTRADSIVNTVLRDYPQNTIFLRIKARIALATSQFDTAIAVGGKLASLSLRRNPVNWSDLLSGYQTVAESYEKKGDTLQCLDVARRVLVFEIPSTAKEISYVRKHLSYMEETVRKYTASGGNTKKEK